ncbi:MAG: DUF4325 domain-containing protein [Gemmatimonadetes bacterium]|nr:DUF4325 domain-containing protein [Gemmatimonadota bacterium]MYA11758.1 DUF4325 domain-containing protein [Gemmatimonadota bacterium]MYE68616.1 DUF4325 domain-containing protein [Gemmatimonadota bacterium]MYJ68790.1 DUF4325 domain-containing protein [Gemmatimonadota bacterium]
MGTVERKGNSILVRDGVFPDDLPRLCAELHRAIGREEDLEIALDFSGCTAVFQNAMLPVIPLVVRYREAQRIVFVLNPPLDRDLRKLFLNTNWAHHIDPGNHPPNRYPHGHVPALRFHGDGDNGQEAILERVLELILGTLDTSRDMLKAVEWSLGEIMDNVPMHAESPVGGFVQATAYTESNSVEFVVADAGIGIAASMGHDDDQAALRAAITEGVTRDRERNAGNGLFGSYQVAALSSGEFEIRSNRGVLRRAGSGSLKTWRPPAPYMGTSVRCKIGLDESGLLERALRFKGKPHDPPHDFVERVFESDTGLLVMKMADKASSHFGSRKGGRHIRRVVENLLRDHPAIVFDFKGVGVFTSSFADEVFGRLFVSMGPRAFMTRIQMRNVDPTVEGLIDRAIVQRTRLGSHETDPRRR